MSQFVTLWLSCLVIETSVCLDWPSDWYYYNRYCCKRSWSSSCGSSCAQAACESIGNTVFLDVDPSASPYVCCDDSIDNIYPIIEEISLNWYEAENECNKKYNGHLMVVSDWQERSIFEHLTNNHKYWNGIFYNSSINAKDWDTVDETQYYWSTGGVGWDSFSKIDLNNGSYPGACLYMETTDAHAYFYIDSCDNENSNDNSDDNNIYAICQRNMTTNSYDIWIDIQCSKSGKNDYGIDILGDNLINCYNLTDYELEYYKLYQDAFSLYKPDYNSSLGYYYGLSVQFINDNDLDSLLQYWQDTNVNSRTCIANDNNVCKIYNISRGNGTKNINPFATTTAVNAGHVHGTGNTDNSNGIHAFENEWVVIVLIVVCFCLVLCCMILLYLYFDRRHKEMQN